MKKISLLFILFICSFLLTGCFYYRGGSDATTTKEWKTEAAIDINSIENEIYSNVYSKVEAELYSSIYDKILEEYNNGQIDIDSLQNIIYKTVNKCKEVNVGVSNLRKNANNELVVASTGSGVIYDITELTDSEYSYRYYVITNEHVVDEGEAFKIVFEDETAYSATLIAKEAVIDIALLYFDSNYTYATIPLGSSADTKVGEIVLAIGNPKGETLFGSVSLGIIGGKDRNLLDDNGSRNTINKYLQHDAAINAGNSGGGLYNLKGECIGINSVKYVSSEIEGLNFAIPIDVVKEYIRQINEYGEYRGTPKFGIQVASISDLTQQGRVEYNIPTDITSGVLVIAVDEGESADGVLEAGDIIIKIDDIDIYSTREMALILQDHLIGDTINIIIVRNGETRTVQMTFIRKAK